MIATISARHFPSFTFNIKDDDVREIVNNCVKSKIKSICIYRDEINYKKGTIEIRYEIERLSE